MPEAKKEQKDDVSIVQVPTQLGLAFQIPGQEEPLNMEQYLAWLGNILYQLNKKL